MSTPRWLRGVLDGADKTTEDVRLGHGPPSTHNGGPRLDETTQSVDAMMQNVEHINKQLAWHTSEMERLIALRREQQDAIIDQLIPLGIIGEVAK